MRDWQLWDEHLLIRLNEHDVANVVRSGGFAKECFPNALIQTYLEYSYRRGRPEISQHLDRLCSLGWDLLYRKPQLMPGAETLLSKLADSHQLYLLSKGDPDLQRYKIRDSGLEPYFQKIYVARQKSSQYFSSLISSNGLNAGDSWSVGNSVKSDINPALQAGLRCIHLITPTWEYEHDAVLGHCHTARDLPEVDRIISSRGQLTAV